MVYEILRVTICFTIRTRRMGSDEILASLRLARRRALHPGEPDGGESALSFVASAWTAAGSVSVGSPISKVGEGFSRSGTTTSR